MNPSTYSLPTHCLAWVHNNVLFQFCSPSSYMLSDKSHQLAPRENSTDVKKELKARAMVEEEHVLSSWQHCNPI